MGRSRTISTVLLVITCVLLVSVSPLIYDDFMDRVGPRSQVELGSDEGVLYTEGSGDYPAGVPHTVTAQVRDGYCFKGWYDDSGRLVSADRCYSMLTKDIRLQARTEPGYSITLFRTGGFSDISGSGPHAAGTDAVLKAQPAEGYAFAGWYGLDGSLLSLEPVYEPGQEDAAVIAKTQAVSFECLMCLEVAGWPDWYGEDSYCIITDWFSGDYVHSFKGKCQYDISVPPGIYDITYCARHSDGEVLQETDRVRFDGTITEHYVWHSEGKEYQADISTTCDIYKIYNALRISRAPVSDVIRHQYIKADSPTLMAFAERMEKLTEGMTDLQRANCVLDFVQQCIAYQSDPERCGQAEYWKFPYETLMEHRGDCEDTAILYVTIMQLMGCQSSLLLFIGGQYAGSAHVAAAVALEDGPADGTYFEKDGKRYYYCETTSDAYKLGDGVKGYDNPHILPLDKRHPALGPDGDFLILASE